LRRGRRGCTRHHRQAGRTGQNVGKNSHEEIP
jgi:hypothetical protein